jgi:hypothetical protein
VIGILQRSGMIAVVSLRLLYLIFQQVLGLLLLMGRTASTKDVELLVLRTRSRYSAAPTRVGFQNSDIATDQRFEAAGSYSLINPPRTGRRRPCRGPARGQASPGTADAAAALDAAAACCNARIRGKHPPQMTLSEDQHPVGELGSNGQHEAFGEAVRPRTTA